MRESRSRTDAFAVNLVMVCLGLRLLAVIEWSLRTRRLDETCAALGIGLATPRVRTASVNGQRGAHDVPWGAIHRTAARAQRIMQWWPFEDTCLRRCLLWGAILRSHGPVLRVGVRRNHEGEVIAHSWLVIAGQSIDTTSGDFARLDVE